jgi:FkbM family methyltransferase
MPFEKLRSSLRYLFAHPAFQESPLRVGARIIRWELFKVFHHEPVILIHKRSRMRLTPGPRRGFHGMIYAFRDRLETGLPASIQKYVQPGDTVFDIGGNIGLWSTLLAEAVGPSGRVETFEPVPPNIERLEENIGLSGHQNVHINKIALGSKPGEITMYVPRDAGRSALAPESDHDARFPAKLVRLDDFWIEAGSPRVPFVKMDVEGAEPEVLRGAHQFISTCRPVIITEINAQKLSLMKEQKTAIHEILHTYNYKSFIFNDSTHEFEPAEFLENSDFFEVLFVPQPPTGD